MSDEESKQIVPVPASPLISDLAGLGKVATSLIEVFGRFIDRRETSRAIRDAGKAQADANRDLAEAEAYREITLTRAEVEKRRILEEEQEALQKRAISRVALREAERQYNIEKTFSIAINLTEQEASASDDPRRIDNDWMNRYLDFVQNVSDPDVQMIWARILKRQGTRVGRSISLMTLDSLRLMEYEHAVAFDFVARSCATFGSVVSRYAFEQAGIKLTHLSALKSLGFIEERDFTGSSIPLHSDFYLTTETPGEQNNQQTKTQIFEGEHYVMSFRGNELASVILKGYEDNETLLRANPYHFLDVSTQADMIAAWAFLLGQHTVLMTAIEDDADTQKKRVATHKWDWRRNGWQRLYEAQALPVPECIQIKELDK